MGLLQIPQNNTNKIDRIINQLRPESPKFGAKIGITPRTLE